MVGERSELSPSYVLAIDTSLSAASACLLERGEESPFVSESMPMERGHAEALLPMVDRLVARADGGFSAIERIAVTIGPGSFTGIRVGVAAARAFALACRVPAVGISTLSVLAAPAIAAGSSSLTVAAIDAHHGNVYVQSFAPDGSTRLKPSIMAISAAVRALGPGPFRLIGSGATMMAIEAWSLGLAAEVDEGMSVPDIAFVARIGFIADPARALPRPFYLRPADAKPQTNGVIARSA